MGLGAHAAADTIYSLGKEGTLHVALPTGWSGASDGLKPATVTLKSPVGKKVSIQVTPVPVPQTDEVLKEAANAVGAEYARQSVEKKVTLQEVKGPAMHGYISAYTDASKGPVEFRFVCTTPRKAQITRPRLRL